METGTLIKKTIEEQVFIKINVMRQNELTAKQANEIEKLEGRIKCDFFLLVWKYFGISECQAKQFSDQELKALFFIVHKKAEKTAVYIKTLSAITVVGWFMVNSYGAGSDTVDFTNSVRKLKKKLGNSFDPVKILRSI